ncbi:hypothetical protein [Syntrophomonas palmitatica]|uniref:hypothetical protein n=1 Tax=Syntrophomonas palmitatica TaxID=402877 RepID=UPI0006D14CEB|nr:hypothetical protein [Syntrophomonas palmitatica]
MKKIAIFILILISIMVFAPVVFATTSDNEVIYYTDESNADYVSSDTQIESGNGVTAISPEEGASRLNTALIKAYKAGADVVPNLALIGLVVGAIIIIIAAALSLDRLLKISIVGMAVILMAVAVVYAAPFLTAMAKGFGKGL